MKIKIIQNSIGRYNLCSNEESLSSRIGIVDDEGKIIKGGMTDEKYPKEISALIDFGCSDDCDRVQEDVVDLFDDFYISGLIELSRRLKRLSFSTRCDYEEDTKFFIKTLKENFDEIRNNFIEERNSVIDRKIESLQEKRKKSPYTESIDEF